MNERREYVRYDCHLILAVSCEHSRVVEFEGQSLNLSRGGLIFSSTVELAEDQLIKIAFDKNEKYIFAEGNVVRKEQEKESESYVYGVKFPVMLSESDLEELLALARN